MYHLEGDAEVGGALAAGKDEGVAHRDDGVQGDAQPNVGQDTIPVLGIDRCTYGLQFIAESVRVHLDRVRDLRQHEHMASNIKINSTYH